MISFHKFLCSSCNAKYSGEAEHYIRVRSGKHLSLSALTGKRIYSNKKFKIQDRSFCSNHDLTISEYETIDLKDQFKRQQQLRINQ